MKKVLMKNRTSSNAIARMVLRRKLESDSGKQIDRSGGGMADRRLLAYDPSAAPDIRTLLSNCVVVMVGCYVMFIAKDEEHRATSFGDGKKGGSAERRPQSTATGRANKAPGAQVYYVLIFL